MKLNNMSIEIKKIICEEQGNIVFAYGAAPTSVVNSLLLDYDQHISAYIDDNPIRQNKLAPNVFVPVLKPEILIAYQS